MPAVFEDDPMVAGLSYPNGIDKIPYASFMKIKKYSYQEGLKEVARNQNDALGSFSRSKVTQGLVRGASGAVMHLYGSGGGFDSDAKANREWDQTAGNTKTGYTGSGSSNWTGGPIPITRVAGGDNEITLPNGRKTTWNDLKKKKDEAAERMRSGLQASELNVALPEEFQYSYGADWGNKFKLGTMALLADNPARFAALTVGGGLAGGYIAKQIGSLGPLSDAGGGIAKGVANGVKTATNPFNVNSPLKPENIAGLAGMAPNENAIQMFSKIEFRNFELSFQLASRNQKESADIQTIIEWFKRGMHPDSKNGKGSAVMLTFPDVFVLEPRFVPVGDDDGLSGIEPLDDIQHPMMPKTKLCALTSLTVNTTPLGQFQTVFDGTIPLVTLQLKFTETTALTRVDFEGARTRMSKGLDKGFVRSSNMKNHPEVGY